ncbi:unnamed protein product [Schistosoma spindalis]|nr:unnamed protein product [Schistosoma spindale]
MNSNTLTSTGNHSFTSINFTTTITCTAIHTTTITTTKANVTNIPTVITNTSSSTTTTTTINNNATTNTILSKLTDRATYFAVVSDTCAFNRNLCKTRYSRLPFLDLATHISQRPAPWLYHTNREYLRESPSKDPHVYLRFPRYRWHLDYQSPHKKRKTANQKLWCTLQNGLKALGVSSDLVPGVTRKAYSIAGLSIPSSLANYLDVLNPRVSVSHTTGNNANNNNSSNSTISTGTTNRLQHSGFVGTNNSNVHSNSFQRKILYDNHGDYSHDPIINAAIITSMLHDDEHDYIVSDRSQDSVCFLNGRIGGSASNTPGFFGGITGGGDDSTQSFDGMLTMTKRINKNNRTNSDNANISDRRDLQDDCQDTQRSNNNHIMLNKSDYTKTYDLDNVSEDDNNQNRDYDVEDYDGEMGEEMDDDDVGDDADWSAGRRRGMGRGGNLGNNCSGGGNNGLVMSGNGRRGKTRSMYSLKVTKYNRKMVNQKVNRSSQNFPALSSRLGGRRFTKRHLGRPFSGRLRANDSRMDDLSYTYAKSSPSVGRRGSRAISRLGTRHMSDSWKGLQRYGIVRDKLNECNDSWDVDNEPGFQLNATPITPTINEKHEGKLLGNCNTLNDRLNTSNLFSSSSSYPSTSSNSLYLHSSLVNNDRSLSAIYESTIQNQFTSDRSSPLLSQSKFVRSSATPANWSYLVNVNQSNVGTQSSTTVNMSISSISSSCIVSSSSPMDSCRISEQPNNLSLSRRYDSNDYVMRVEELSKNHESSPQMFSSGRRPNTSRLSNCSDTMNRYNPLSVPSDSFHNTPSINSTAGSMVNPVFSNVDQPNNNTNNSPINTSNVSDIMRIVDISSTDKSNNGRVVGDLQTFVNPQTATTTVTFFVCEVCSSRYRSTAGLRYHYHSQHSGYTPQNPISASASRLVVPVGEERGIGGGLRGGRPRRHRGSTASSKSRDKLANSHYPNEYQISSEQDDRSDSILSSQYSKITNPYSPSSQNNKRGHNNINRIDCKTMDSRSIVEPKLIDLIASQTVPLKYQEKVHVNHFNSIESDNDNSESLTNNNKNNNNLLTSVEMKNLPFMDSHTSGSERLSQCSMPSSSSAITPGKFVDSTDSIVVVSDSSSSSRFQMIDYTNYNNTTINSSNNLPHTNIHSVQRHNTLQSSSSSSSFNSPISHLGNSVIGNKIHSHIPYSHPHHHHPYLSSQQLQSSPQNNWNSPNTIFNQMPYGSPSVPSSQTSFPRMTPATVNHVGPQQRRYERQHCPDRLGLTCPSINSTTSSRLLSTSTASMPTCDYCLGDDNMNPRIGHPEGMLQCSRCGHSAHYTCLRLPMHIIDAAMRYPWQCIECKTCWLCDQDDHEDRMIFCWNCDRVFHAHCIPARLPRTLDAHWTCDICLHEIYNSNNRSIFDQRTHTNSDYEVYANSTCNTNISNTTTNNNSNRNGDNNDINSFNQINTGNGYFTNNVQHHTHNTARS